MKPQQLRSQLTTVTHADSPVMAITEDGVVYSIVDVVYDPITEDDTGSTVWLKLEEF